MISMDWMPTLLAAAGGLPDPAFPSDGQNLLAVLTGAAPAHSRKLYWLYKADSQRAIREGDMKYLHIAGNEFLFNVVNDPRERANLKGQQKDVFARLKGDWDAWNATMLPERTRPAAYTNSAEFMADHYGAPIPPAFPKPPAR